MCTSVPLEPAAVVWPIIERQPTTNNRVNAILLDRLFLSTKLNIIIPLLEPNYTVSLSILYENANVSIILQHCLLMKLVLNLLILQDASRHFLHRLFGINLD